MNTLPDSLYQPLLLVNNILVRETNPEDLFRNLATTLQSLVHCDRCSLTIYDATTDSMSWFAQAEGITVKQMDNEEHFVRGPLAYTAIQTRQPYIVPDLTVLASSAGIQHMLDVGLKSSIAMPLMSRSEPVGAMVISYLRALTAADNSLIAFLEKISVQVALAVDNMLAHEKLKKMNCELKQHVGSLLYPEGVKYAEQRFFYTCEKMQHIIEQARLLANSDVPVLVCGETGTGKEFIAHYIHQHSTRSKNNFVKVNCPALSSTLFESELFGHAKGAFTGAVSQRVGRFEMANKGSIFLDEIGDLDKMLQAKLLQVLQDACFERVGESRSVHIDVRFISATNAPLQSLMSRGLFRSDLYYRLGAATIYIPPLRQREGELEPMIKHLVTIASEDLQCAPLKVSPSAMRLLTTYTWPGNVRELLNIIKRLLILHHGHEVTPEMILPFLQQPEIESEHREFLGTGLRQGNSFENTVSAKPSMGASLPRDYASSTLQDAERKFIEHALTSTNGVVSGSKGAAAMLGLPRSTLLYKLQKHCLDPKAYSRAAKRT
ncbi:MAG: sigma 54-interacting transcriptional regulator [Desulfovibrionaceae bacterium]